VQTFHCDVSSVMLGTNKVLEQSCVLPRLLSDLTWYGVKPVWWDLSCACDVIEVYVRGSEAW
jgi:hypothetical protein